MSDQSTATEPLFKDFPLPSYDDWRAAAEATLKGAPFEKRLVGHTYEGIDLQPIYNAADIQGLPHLGSLPGQAPFVRDTSPLGDRLNSWAVAQELPHPLPAHFNAALQADLPRGQNAVNLPLDAATLAGLDADQAPTEMVGTGGVSISGLADLETALAGVNLEKTPFYAQASTTAFAFTALVVALLEKQGKDLKKLQGAIGMDPLGQLARAGSLPRDLPGIYDVMARLSGWAADHAPGLHTITVQGHPYHDGGASAVQELAFALATGVEYLRELADRGVDVNTAAPRIRMAFSLGGNLFMEIARLRAARLLWSRAVAAFGGDERAQQLTLHGRTSRFNKTAFDPYVNMLRVTTEAFAGVVGGCDSLHVGAFDEILREPDEFSRRISRNVHTVLREESGLDRTADPAGGSYYVEWLTDAIAREAWTLFQSVEKQGGMFAALEAGFPQSEIARVSSKRTAAVAARRDRIVGVNMYANMKEKFLPIPTVDRANLQRQRAQLLGQIRNESEAGAALEALARDPSLPAAAAAARAGATLGAIARALRTDAGDGPRATAIPASRVAIPFESLRQATERHTEATGERPRVLLLNLGKVHEYKPRADFSRGFLEVAAFQVEDSPPCGEVEEAVDAAVKAEAPIVVFCGSDKGYPERIPALAARLSQERPDTILLLAGYPQEHVDSFRGAGVDDFIHLRANCLELLTTLQQRLGVGA